VSSNSPFQFVAAQWAVKMQETHGVFIDGYYVRLEEFQGRIRVIRQGYPAEDIEPTATVLVRRRLKGTDWEKDWKVGHESEKG
jgi:hypothetical protein